jgi:glycyl-tRNA synthetase
MAKETKLDKITSVALRRGFFWPTAEIYGGKTGFYSYGHLGKAMKNKFEQLWRSYFLKENCYEIEASTILPERVFKASGHLEHFNDPLVECKTCHFRFRADQLLEDNKIKAEGLTIEEMTDIITKEKLRCPKCDSWHLSSVQWYNMMFPIQIGAVGSKDTAYLVPETAQAAYLGFKREFEATRKKLPLGIAIIGKAFRNEISPRQLFFRLREFSQAELQIFFDPADINKAHDWKEFTNYKLILLPQKQNKVKEVSCEEVNKKLKLPKLYIKNMALVQQFYLNHLKIPKAMFRLREISEEERAHYNKLQWDVEIKLETLGGFKEVSGIHYRTDYDLSRHEKESKENLCVFYNNKKFIPHVIELSFGIDRNLWALLDVFFKEEKERTIFNFPLTVSPYDLAIFPLVSREKMPELAKKVYNILKADFACFYDETDSIGRRYRRQDEIGTPFCLTIDSKSLKDKTVTVRARDSMKQDRVKIDKLKEAIK